MSPSPKLAITVDPDVHEKVVGAAFAVSPFFEMLFMVWFGHIATRGHQRRVIIFGVVAATCYFSSLRFVTAAWHVYPMQIKDGSMRDMWLSKTERT